MLRWFLHDRINKTVNKCFLAGDKFMPEMNFRKSVLLSQPGFTYSVCDPFNKSKERIQKFKETEDSRYICRNGQNKTYFQHYMAYRNFKDLPRRTASDKLLRAKVVNIAKKFMLMLYT